MLLHFLILIQLLGTLGQPLTRGDVKRVSIPPGFSRCLFYDNFSDRSPGSLPSPLMWTVDRGTSYPGGPEGWGTGEVQFYTNHRFNIRITDRSTLLITPTKTEKGTWDSSRIETTEAWDFGCQPGHQVRMEAGIKLGDRSKVEQLGIWPAFWELVSDYRNNYQNWPSVGKIDIMESPNGEDRIWHTVHCGVNPGGPCNEANGVGKTASVSRGKWHSHAVEISCADRLTSSICWYINGVEDFCLDDSKIKNQTVWSRLIESQKFLLLNVAVGGGFPDALAAQKTPTETTQDSTEVGMEVDFVAVLERVVMNGECSPPFFPALIRAPYQDEGDADCTYKKGHPSQHVKVPVGYCSRNVTNQNI